LDQPPAELLGGDTGDGAPEIPAAPAARGPTARPFPSFGAGPGEVKVFDHDGTRIVGLGGGDQSADSGSQVPVAGSRRQPSQIQTDSGWGAEDVAVWCDDSGS
jgi:hypothetical protein